jgi:endonuclease/exonuclease/phosphatase family metal-dependent hydrolase
MAEFQACREVSRATLISWNVAGRVARLDEQVERLTAYRCDLVCLQEVTPTTAPRWVSALKQDGHTYVGVARLEPREATPRRPLSVLVASRWDAAEVPVEGLPWSERVLAVRTNGLEVVGVHSPISPSPGLAKVLTHETLHRHLAGRSGPRIVCGDLNTPRREHPDGRVWTFARDRYGRLRQDRGERWDEAELALIKGLEPYGFRDAYRERHGPQGVISWAWGRWRGGYRLDHLIASREVSVNWIDYLHEWRNDGLSDHSPLAAELAWER